MAAVQLATRPQLVVLAGADSRPILREGAEGKWLEIDVEVISRAARCARTRINVELGTGRTAA
eukprot:6207145-Pleurochrysis_carterae.AAC.1